MDKVVAAFSSTRAAALTLGTGTIVVTHAYMLLAPEHDLEDPGMLRNHAVLNLVAAAAVVYGSNMLG